MRGAMTGAAGPLGGNGGNAGMGTGPQLGEAGDVVIWGTTINVQTCANLFRDFLEHYTHNNDFELFYHKQLQIIHRHVESTISHFLFLQVIIETSVPQICVYIFQDFEHGSQLKLPALTLLRWNSFAIRAAA